MINFDKKVLKLFNAFRVIYDADISGCTEGYGMMFMNVNNVLYKWENFYTGINNDYNPCSFVPNTVSTNHSTSRLSWLNNHAKFINDNMRNRVYIINNVMYYYDNNIVCHQIDIKEFSTDDYFNLQFILNDRQLISFQLGYLIYQKFSRNFFLSATSVEKCIQENFNEY